MHGMPCVEVDVVHDLPALSPAAAGLLDRSGELFSSRLWWDVVLSDALPPDAAPVFLHCHIQGRTLALLPLLRHGKARPRESLTTPYTCRYAPLLTPGLDSATRVAALAAILRAAKVGTLRLDCLPAEWEALADLLAAARQAGLVPLRFDHFGNWYEEVAELDWAGYLGRRPGALRETIRRRLRRSADLAGARFELWTAPSEMEAATAAYGSVYARSWKEPEPFPNFNLALMRALAQRGSLRFGLWSIGTTPVAAQIWVVEAGHATVLKLAHDEAFKTHSPGTVLTALVLHHLLDKEHVREIDFGRGDDPYKQGWASQRRQRIGLLLVNPWRPAGALALLRHTAGQWRRTLRR